eukprot:6362644-Pyramimonas_sp.AAC.1
MRARRGGRPMLGNAQLRADVRIDGARGARAVARDGGLDAPAIYVDGARVKMLLPRRRVHAH